MAFGAQHRNIRRWVPGHVIRLTITGVAAGLATSLVMTRLLSDLLFGVSATDPMTFASVSLVLVMSALLVSSVPLRRATRVNPMEALRYE
ncbi:MAG: FtsX-like permease family protein [Acidobacteria bacterium]|nr:MAG: FtsX-like permease family protein [Acidobacteriota bacterium]